MPFIQVISNQKLTPENTEVLKAKLGETISIMPGKSESWLMVQICDGEKLFFSGSGDPAAIVNLSSFGREQTDECYDRLTEEITEICSSVLDVPGERCYVKYESTLHWGWNKKNFQSKKQ